MTQPSIIAQGYDAVYEAMPRSPTFRRIWQDWAAGDDYPDDFYHISFLTLQELREIRDALRLSHEMVFCDVACGMGGPSLWMAKETGARVYGVDFSGVAIEQAARRAAALGLAAQAKFETGTFAQTGLPSHSMDAVMTVDGLQYAPNKAAAVKEIARILRRGGRLALTAFGLDPDRTGGLPVIGEDPVSDYRPLLENEGFAIVQHEETPRWRERLTGAYGAVVAAKEPLEKEMGPLATAALMSEMTITLDRKIYRSRVFIIAERT